MQNKTKNILIIGISKMGKTHFGGQLYGRLKSLQNAFKLGKTPDDLSLFENILDCLEEGLEGKHTSSSEHKTIVLPIENSANKNNKIDIVYPDYGGEQISNIISQRIVAENWKTQIEKSSHWFLFIRLDLMEKMEDVTTLFYKQIEGEGNAREMQSIQDLQKDSSAFYIELIQIFLYVKRLGLTSKNKPKLTILLSCWDKLCYPETTIPMNALKDKMPLFANFVSNIWAEENLEVIGLSSTGKDLDKEKNDRDYQRKGPEKFGFFITKDGNREDDLTKILNNVS